MDFNPYTHIKTLVIGADGVPHEEIVPAPEGYAPEFGRQGAHDGKWAEVRAERDLRLKESDWVVMRAVERGEPVPAQWQAYREALREITHQLNPFFITWPTPPAPAAPVRRAYHTAEEYEANVPNEVRL